METMTDLQVSAYGAQLTSLKIYNFTITDTGQISSTGSTGGGPSVSSGERLYTIGGMTTNEVPIALMPTTGAWGQGGQTSPGPMMAFPRINTTATSQTNNLIIGWVRMYTTTQASSFGATATGSIATTTGVLAQLFTMGMYAPAVSTTT